MESKESSGLPGPMAGVQRAKEGGAEHRTGDVVERIFDGRAVRHYPEAERFHCLNYPCNGKTSWFYLPAWSHLCMECMVSREATRERALSRTPQAAGESSREDPQ